jgi:hypothetical protein
MTCLQPRLSERDPMRRPAKGYPQPQGRGHIGQYALIGPTGRAGLGVDFLRTGFGPKRPVIAALKVDFLRRRGPSLSSQRDLTPAQRAKLTAQRKGAYQAAHKGTGHGGAPGRPVAARCRKTQTLGLSQKTRRALPGDRNHRSKRTRPAQRRWAPGADHQRHQDRPRAPAVGRGVGRGGVNLPKIRLKSISYVANEAPPLARLVTLGHAPQPCRVPPSDAPRTPRIAGDQDTAACCFPPDYARLGMLPISSRLRTPLGFPTRCAKHKVCDPQPRDL